MSSLIHWSNGFAVGAFGVFLIRVAFESPDVSTLYTASVALGFGVFFFLSILRIRGDSGE